MINVGDNCDIPNMLHNNSFCPPPFSGKTSPQFSLSISKGQVFIPLNKALGSAGRNVAKFRRAIGRTQTARAPRQSLKGLGVTATRAFQPGRIWVVLVDSR